MHRVGSLLAACRVITPTTIGPTLGHGSNLFSPSVRNQSGPLSSHPRRRPVSSRTGRFHVPKGPKTPPRPPSLALSYHTLPQTLSHYLYTRHRSTRPNSTVSRKSLPRAPATLITSKRDNPQRRRVGHLHPPGSARLGTVVTRGREASRFLDMSITTWLCLGRSHTSVITTLGDIWLR